MSDKFKPLPRLAEVLKNDKLNDLGRVILGETPIGKGWRIVKGLTEIFGTSDEDELIEAYEKMSPDQFARVMELQAQAEETLSNERIEIEREISARHATDTMSGPLISKLVRPVGLAVTVICAILYIFGIPLLLAFGPELTPDELDAISVGGEAITDFAKWFAGFYVSFRTVDKGVKMVKGAGK
jgi:hypothetical protein